jgi:phosphatidylserine/phosphatidylglycerophosphate/cardiolipin synthase-like enzyme
MRQFLAIAALVAVLLPPPCFSAEPPCGLDAHGSPTYSPLSAPEIAFSPNGGATEMVVRTIDSAKSSVRVAAYTFTSKPIAQALLEAHKRGIDVRVVVDKSNVTARYTAATVLANMGVPVRVDYNYAIMHDKFVVVDGQVVESGSFNFTAAAETKNAENVLVLHDAAVAQRYGQEWERLWSESEPMRPKY